MKFIVNPSTYWVRLRELPDSEKPFYILPVCRKDW